MKLKIWWIPQIPMKAFVWPVDSVETAMNLLTILAEYDKFQYENNVKPDYSNAGGLLMWDEEDQEWIEWENDDGEDIYDLMRK